MVTYSDDSLDRVFGALSDPIRRELLARLADGDYSVSELAAPFEISRPAISKHLNVLERAGLIRRTREGRIQRCRLKASPLGDAVGYLERYREFWEEKLDRFQRYVESMEPEGDET